MGIIYYPSRAKPELIIDIPALESYSLSRPAQRLQSRQVTPGGRAVVTGLGKKIQFLNLNIKNLSQTDKNTLVDLLDNYVNGSQYTFDYVDGQGNDFYGCRLWQGDEDFVQAFYQRYEENLLLRVNPTKHIYAGSGNSCKIFRSNDGETWTEVGDLAEYNVLCLAYFKGYLYAGTGSADGKIYRSADGLTWTEVEDTAELGIEELFVFNDYLYAGTSTAGKIYRSADGLTWTEVEDTTENYINCFAVFGDYLYVGTSSNGKILRSADGLTWSEVYDSAESHIYCLTVFDGYLYAGSGNPDGKIYRSATGDSGGWSEVEDTGETEVWSLCVFTEKSAGSTAYLYAGTGGNGKIFRSANGTDWSEVGDVAEADIYDLVAFDGYLYAGAATPDGKVYRSADGTTWTAMYDTGDANVFSLSVLTF